MKLRPLIVIGALAVAPTASACLSVGVANAAVPNCGGQSAPPQPVPYQCDLPGIDITASGFTRHFAAHLSADGTHVTVQWVMTGGVLPVAVPIQMIHHIGISGAGGPETAASGVVPAGQTTATLSVTSPCFAGQVDIWAVSTGPNFRVGGPWIQNGTGCTVVTTTVPQSSTTVTATSVPSSTVPPPASVPQPTTSAPTVPSVTSKASGGTLPPTGVDRWLPLIGLGLLVGGLLAITAAISRRPS
jgi:hypothetical protein